MDGFALVTMMIGERPLSTYQEAQTHDRIEEGYIHLTIVELTHGEKADVSLHVFHRKTHGKLTVHPHKIKCIQGEHV